MRAKNPKNSNSESLSWFCAKSVFHGIIAGLIVSVILWMIGFA
jgi:flagellar biosynthesis protein FliR